MVPSYVRSWMKVGRKSGPKQREWAELDEKYLPRVKELVDKIYNAEGKPQKVSVTRVEREIGAPPKQFQKLPKCTRYVMDHMETQNEYRARRVTWAVKLFLQGERYISHNKLNHFLTLRRNDLQACLPFIRDEEVKNVVNRLLEEERQYQEEMNQEE